MNTELVFKTSYDFAPLPDRIIDVFNEWKMGGKLGFMDLPGDSELLSETLGLVDTVRGYADRMIVCGIGGSSLGLRALLSAFSKTLDEKAKVVVADSPDSGFISSLTRCMNPDRTSVTVITKSGGTAETISVFLSLYRWIAESANGEKGITVITDPQKGDLRRLANDRNWSSLPVPHSVGGRFSVLSPVGLFPAAFAGIDVKALLQGALAVAVDFSEKGTASLAAAIAAGFVSNFSRYPVHVFFPYEDRLFDTALWFSQLWAESLGKKMDLSGRPTVTGQTPLACRGPADQHSLVQLFMEGPRDKTVTILTTPPDRNAPQIPGGFEEYPSLAYLSGLTSDELRTAEAQATGKAFEENDIPVSYIEMKKLDERSLGELIMSLEIATVLAGLALDINPLDQPGVERGKILTYAALNRPGYEA
ncbi:MAG: glucose-6-phosphate isomerase [Candidatus Aegiribacteria sp.]|nr:glucose-6-phosphate isomerase [Candidatus Aegiribacteria sp.]